MQHAFRLVITLVYLYPESVPRAKPYALETNVRAWCGRLSMYWVVCLM